MSEEVDPRTIASLVDRFGKVHLMRLERPLPELRMAIGPTWPMWNEPPLEATVRIEPEIDVFYIGKATSWCTYYYRRRP